MIEKFTSREEIDESKFVASLCPRHGWFKEAIRAAGGELQWLHGCPRCEAERVARRLLSQSMIPLRYRDKYFDSYSVTNTHQSEALSCCKAFVSQVFNDMSQTGKGLLLIGRPGTGKTHLACAILNELISEQHRSVFYTNADKLLARIKSTWSSESAISQFELIEKLAKFDLLVIDEIGANRSITLKDKDLFFAVINERYEQLKSTIYVSNLDLTGDDSIETYLEERSCDRIYEQSRVVIFDWDSYRRQP